MSFARGVRRRKEKERRRRTMRYIQLRVTDDELEKIEARSTGDKELKDGVFGQGELLRKLLEMSPKCTKMADVTKLVRVSRKIEELSGNNPVLEVAEDEWDWIKLVLDHDKYAQFGSNFLKIIGETLEAVENAKPELKAVRGKNETNTQVG